MRDFFTIVMTFVLVGFFGSSVAFSFEFHGYMRSGLGFSKGGSDQACFRAPGTEGASGKHRLGNECDTYVELGLSEKFSAKDASASSPFFTTNVKFALASAGHRDYEPSNTYKDQDGNLFQDFTLSLREAYATGENILPGKATLWTGKRYYRRIDIHMLDYYVVDNTGPGLGVEGIDLERGQVHVALTRNVPARGKDFDPAVGPGPAQTNIDLRVEVDAAGGGKAQAIAIFGTVGENDSQTGEKSWEKLTGGQYVLLHTQPVLGGQNMFVLQYGVGLFGAVPAWGSSALNQYGAWGSQNIAEGDDAGLDARKDSSSLRLVEQLVVHPTTDISGEFVILYQSVDFGGGEVMADGGLATEIPNKVETTFGARPIYHFDNTWSLALEYGYTRVENAIRVAKTGEETEFKDSALNKVTLAPQVSFGNNYWARPTLRLFATYASWNDDSKGQVSDPPVYSESTSGFSVGSQVEAWW